LALLLVRRINSYSQNHNLGGALLSAGGSFVGSNLAGNILGDKLGTIGSGFNSVLGNDLGSTAANAIGPTLANTTISSVLGGNVGSTLASSLAGTAKNASPSGEGATPAFKPTQQSEMALPFSLQGLGGLTTQQQGSNIATKGVYGGGEGPDENSYFLNLINRRLVDPQGNVGDMKNVSPIENSYLAQLGLGGSSNAKNLLQAISNWKA
jgi:hypothetical protein